MNGFGGPGALTDAVKAAGRRAGYRTKWGGAWNMPSRSGVGADWDSFFRDCKAQSQIPVIPFFFMGDQGRPNALRNGVKDPYQGGVFKTVKDGLDVLTAIMAKAAGVAPIVAVENESASYNLDDPAPFRAYFDECAKVVHAAGGKVIFSPGDWSDQARVRTVFAQQVASSDYLSVSCVKFAPTHGATAISSSLGPAIGKALTTLRGATGKSIALCDVAVSSYGGAYAPAPPYLGGSGASLENGQADALRSLAAIQGLEFFCYRDLKDNPTFNTANYGGMAERSVGVMRADGSRKPAFEVLMAMAPPAVSTPLPTPTAPVPRTYTQAEMDAVQNSLQDAQAATQRLLDEKRAWEDGKRVLEARNAALQATVDQVRAAVREQA